MGVFVPISVGGWVRLFSRWDILAVLLILGLLVVLGEASRHLFEPLADLQRTPPSLDPANLPEYAARTTLRMFIAMALSLLFTFTYATLAAKNKQAERILVPLLDILQSVPILGFISVTVVFFMALAPGRVLGAEFAAIFAIFTSQAWNMAFSFYQSLRTVPTELVEASRSFRLSPWMSFWRVDVPFAMPQLIWNMMMSMSGSWFFVVASEAISVGNTTGTFPCVGSYIAIAIEQQNLKAVGWAIGTMLVVILIYDQILFRPLVAWADRFRFEQEPGIAAPHSWVLDILRRSRIVDRTMRPFALLWRRLLLPRHPDNVEAVRRAPRTRPGWIAFQLGLIVFVLSAFAFWEGGRRIPLPAVLPYYVTGAITASGGSWNASIVAEVASWGNKHLEAAGLGAYIARQTDAGDFHRVVLGIAVMSLYVVVINRVFWRPLYHYAERKFRLG